MADKHLGIGIKVKEAEIRKELEKLKQTIRSALGDLGKLGGTDTTDAIKQQQQALKALTDQMSKMSTQVRDVVEGQRKMSEGAKKNYLDVLNLRGGIQRYVKDVENMLLIQARWYGAKFALFSLVSAPTDFIKSGYEYVKILDDWNAKLLRWGASSGEVTAQARTDIKSLVDEMSKATLAIPVSMDKLGKGVEGFIGAGISPNIIKQITKEIAALTSTYPEINMEQFGTAIVGFYNSFKDTIKGAATEAEKFKIIMDQLVAAQAKGVIRPEAFTLVMQHLGEAARNAGFTTEQMLAMSVVITDLGSKAGSAARAARGFMDQLSKPNVQDKLKAIGIEFEKDKTLAEQFDRIMLSIREKLGGGGTMAMGTQSFLTTIMPVERAKAFTAMLKDWDKYKETIEYIAGSKGGIMAGAGPKAESISGQWELVVNTMARLAKEVTAADTVLKDLVSTMLEVSRAALYAVNPTLATAENMDKLGEAGKTVYAVMNDLVTVSSALWGAIRPVATVLGDLASALLANHTLLMMLANVGIARLVISMLPAISTIKSLIVSIEALIASLRILAATGSLSALALGPAGWAAIAATGIGILVTGIVSYKQHLEDLRRQNQQMISDLEKSLPLMTDFALRYRLRMVEAGISALEDIQKQANTPTGLAAKIGIQPSGPRINALSPEQRAELDRLKKEKELVESQIAFNAGYQPGPYAKEGPKTGLDIDTTKQRTSQLASAIKAYYQALLQEQKAYADMSLSYADSYHKQGLLSDEEFYRKRIENIVTNRDLELSILQKEAEEIEKVYREGIAKTTDSGQKKALEEKYKADSERVHSQQMQIIAKSASQVVASATDQVLKRRQILLDGYQTELDIVKTFIQRELTATQSGINMEEMWMKYLYETGGASATAYYDNLISLANRQTEAKKKALEDEYNAIFEKQDKEFVADGTTKERKAQILREQEKDYFVYTANVEKLERENKERILQINLEMKENIKRIYEEIGAGGVATRAFRDIRIEAENSGQQIYDAMRNCAQNSESALTTFLDTTSNKFMNWHDLVIDILNDVYKELLKVLILKPLTAGLAGGLSGLYNNYMGGYLNGIPSDASYVPAPRASGGDVRAGVPYIVGERRPELFVPDRNGTIYPNVGASVQFNVEVKVENQTGVPGVEAQVTTQRTSAEDIVIGIILKNSGKGGVLDRAFSRNK